MVHWDTDGIDLHFLNSAISGVQMKVGHKLFSNCIRGYSDAQQSSADVKLLFKQVKPARGTHIGRRLEDLILPYLDKLQKISEFRELQGEDKTLWIAENGEPLPVKPVNFIVITDGEPSKFRSQPLLCAPRY